MSTSGSISIDDWRTGRTLTAQHCDGCPEQAGRAVLAHALRHHLDPDQTRQLFDQLGIDPALLRDPTAQRPIEHVAEPITPCTGCDSPLCPDCHPDKAPEPVDLDGEV